MSEEYDIKKSIEKIGHLYPVLKDKHGNVIDGDHRLIEDPEWPTKTLEHIDNPVQLVIARLIANICRRDVPSEEKTKWVKQIAELTGWTPKQIAENLPVSYSWVMKYIPDEFKEKPQVHERLTQTTQVLQRVTQLVECDRCHMATREAVDYKGQNLCPSCLEKAKYKPLKDSRSIPTAKVTATMLKPKDTWQHRKATMTPQVSKMEESVLVKLERKGLHPEVQKQFCLQSTMPDYYFPNKNLAVYLDGEVHKGREDRDEALRELLTKRHGVSVVSISYEGTSQAAEDIIVSRIVETVG